MANYQQLKNALVDVIKQNGNNEITGEIMQTTLLSMINSLGANYQFAGILTPSTNFIAPDENVFFIGGGGTYNNFGANEVVVPNGNIGIFMYNGSYTYSVLYSDEVFDISVYRGTGGTPAQYADLSAALVTNGTINVPEGIRNGGMSVKFIQSSDNKYVQYRLMTTSFSTTVGDWERINNVNVSQNTNTKGQQLYISGAKKGNINDILNVNSYNNKGDAYTDAETSRAAVPSNLRAFGMVITYLLADGWHKEQFVGNDISSWEAETNWKNSELNKAFYDYSQNYVLHDGYLNSQGTYRATDEFYSKTTSKISCKEGDIFYYKGWSTGLAVTALFYNGSTIIGDVQIDNSQSVFSAVTIPTGVDGVVFSSLNYKNSPIVFELIGGELVTSLKDNPNLINLDATASLQAGYLNASGVYAATETLKSKTTPIIDCAEGDVFFYKGRSGVNAVSALFYNDNTIVSSIVDITYPTEPYKKIVIPSGVNKVRFSSYNEINSDVVLSVIKFSLGETFVTKEEIRNIISPVTDFTLQDGYLQSDGTYGSGYWHSLTSVKMGCEEGDVFFYHGWAVGNAVSALFYNGETIVSSVQKNSNSSGQFVAIIIPAGVDGVVFSSFNAKNVDVDIEVYTGKIGRFISGFESAELYKKKINVLGDSYVANNGQPISNTWHYQIAQKYAMTYRNYGINGNGIVSGTNPMSERYVNMDNDADYVLVVGGTNDFNYQTALETFKSALGSFIQNLVAKYPTAKIAFFTPFNDGDTLNPAYVQTENPIRLSNYANAIKEVCDKYGVPCFNSYCDGGMFAWDEAVRTAYFQSSIDKAHLNADGHKKFQNRAETFLIEL